MFLYGKIALACLLYHSNVAALALALSVYAGLFTLVSTPRFAGAEAVEVLDADTFAARCTKKPGVGGPDRMAPVTIVAFTASWADSCSHAEPLFCSLAAQYSSDRRKFATIDVATFSHIARRFDIDLGVRSKQLPTFALFYGGELQRRLPYFNKDKPGEVVRTRFTRASLAQYFMMGIPPKDCVARLKKINKDKAELAAKASKDE